MHLTSIIIPLKMTNLICRKRFGLKENFFGKTSDNCDHMILKTLMGRHLTHFITYFGSDKWFFFCLYQRKFLVIFSAWIMYKDRMFRSGQ